MAHNPFPFRHDAHPDLTAAIHRVVEGASGQGKYPRPGASGGVRAGKDIPPRPAKPGYKYPGGVVHTRYATEGVVSESHTRAQLEKMSITRLRELQKKYAALVVKGDWDAARELADIRGILRARGAGVAVDEGVSPCEAAALKRLKAANAEDLKEKPGAAGAAAHKRLHKTVKSVVGEGVIGDTVQRVKNKLRGAGGRTDAERD